MSLYQSPLYSIPSTRSMTASFGGLNRRPVIADGEFFDMQNLTSDDAPLLSVRPKRGIPFPHTEQTKPAAIAVRGAGGLGVDQAVWLDGTVLHYGLSWTLDLAEYGMTDDNTERRLVAMGAYIIVFPDMIYVNAVETADGGAVAPTDVGKIEDEYVNKSNRFRLEVCDYEGKVATFIQATEPTEAVNGDTWHETGSGAKLRRYDEDRGEWYEIEPHLRLTVYMYASDMLGWVVQPITMKSMIQAGDALRFSGIHPSIDGVKMAIRTETYANMENSVLAIIVKGIIPESVIETDATSDKPVTIERPIPVMDHLIEAGNRLWGCRYGDDGSGHFVNEIYCSASGDFYRWILGDVTNDDSPVTFSVGADGGFTGAVTFQGYPTFFKEHTMFRISGYGASGFAVNDTPCVGVARGAHKSLAVVGNALYYKGPTAVMGFDGSAPVSVSERLGKLTGYTRAVGGACGDKYYLSLYGQKGQGAVLYAMDTTQGVWHKEDATEVESMASVSGNMYFIRVLRKVVAEEETVTHEIRTVTPLSANDPTETAPVRWYAETGIIGLDTPDTKYISKLSIRMDLEAGASVRVSVEYDSSGYWKQIGARETVSLKTVTMPIVPMRCDHMRLRLEGVGGCKVYSITKTLKAGAEV